MRFAVGLALTMALAGTAFAGDQYAPTRMAVREACKGDIATLCAGVQPGEGRIRACLRANKEKLSDGCRSAIAAAIQARREARAAKKSDSTAQSSESAAPENAK